MDGHGQKTLFMPDWACIKFQMPDGMKDFLSLWVHVGHWLINRLSLKNLAISGILKRPFALLIRDAEGAEKRLCHDKRTELVFSISVESVFICVQNKMGHGSAQMNTDQECIVYLEFNSICESFQALLCLEFLI